MIGPIASEGSTPASRPGFRRLFALFGVALPLYALDQISKWWIVKTFAPLEQRVVVEDFFDLCYFMNTGAAFSIGSGRNSFFIALSLVALFALLFYCARGAFADSCSQWGSALLIAGILGNLTDRIVHGHVVDFLLFDLHVRYANPWPAFNIADSCICVAVALFFIASFREGRSSAAPKDSVS